MKCWCQPHSTYSDVLLSESGLFSFEIFSKKSWKKGQKCWNLYFRSRRVMIWWTNTFEFFANKSARWITFTVRWEKALKPQFSSHHPSVTPETCLPYVHVLYANKIILIFVAFESYALKNKQDAAFKYRSVFDVFIYKNCSQSRSVFAWTLCTHDSASSSVLIRVMNKRWWMAKKKIKFQLVACIKESDRRKTVVLPNIRAKRDMSRMYIFISRRLCSYPAKNRLNESRLGERKIVGDFQKALFMMQAWKWRNCINTLERNLFNDARDHLGRVL